MWYLVLKSKRIKYPEKEKIDEGCGMAFVEEVTESVICFDVEEMNKKGLSLTS